MSGGSFLRAALLKHSSSIRNVTIAGNFAQNRFHYCMPDSRKSITIYPLALQSSMCSSLSGTFVSDGAEDDCTSRARDIRARFSLVSVSET